MNVPFDVIDRDQRQPLRNRQSLGVGHAHQQRADQSRALGHGDGRQIFADRAPDSSSASRTAGTMARRCSREASSGTTPPYLECVAICELITDDRMREPSSTTAAAVSSQEDSMPRIEHLGPGLSVSLKVYDAA